MKLVRLVLENVRRFAHLELSFVSDRGEPSYIDRTIIYGENDNGKSTVLQSIALVLAGSSALVEIIGDPERWIRNGKKEAVIAAWLKTEEGEIQSLKLRIKRGLSLTKILLENRESLKNIDSAIDQISTDYAYLAYGVHRRVGRQRNSIYDNSRAESSSTLFSVEASLFPFEKWVKQLHSNSKETVLKDLLVALKEILPGISHISYNKQKRSVLFLYSNNEIYSFSQLSYSKQVSINWVADIIYRIKTIYKDYTEPNDASFILLVDEIGLYLHPSMQRNVVNSLCSMFKSMQLITTSHSPFVIEQFENSAVVVSINNKGKIKMTGRSETISPNIRQQIV